MPHDQQSQRLLAAAVLAGLLLIEPAGATAGTLCYKDSNPSNPDPYNMYMCEDSTKPSCCQEGDLSTCCDYDPAQRTILQQLTIWGLLLATMVGLIIIYLCCFRARNNSGTEIRNPDEQEKIHCGSDCCFFLNKGNKEAQQNSAMRYRDDGPI